MVDGHVIGVGYLLTIHIEGASLRSSDGDYSTCSYRTAAHAEAGSLRSRSKVTRIGGAYNVTGHAVARRASIDRHAAVHLIDRDGKAVGVGLPVGTVGAPLNGAGRTVGDRTADGRAREMGAILGRNRHVDYIRSNLKLVGCRINGNRVSTWCHYNGMQVSHCIQRTEDICRFRSKTPVTTAHRAETVVAQSIVAIAGNRLGKEYIGIAVTVVVGIHVHRVLARAGIARHQHTVNGLPTLVVHIAHYIDGTCVEVVHVNNRAHDIVSGLDLTSGTQGMAVIGHISCAVHRPSIIVKAPTFVAGPP